MQLDINQYKADTGADQKSSEKGSEKSSEKIIKEISTNPTITTFQLASILSISERAVAKQLKRLQDSDIIRRVGPDKGGHWEIVE